MSKQETSTTSKTWQDKTGFYFLPNTFTLTALFFAFFAIIEAIDLRFDRAGWAIVASLYLDGMDGRIARMTGKQSAFGEQLDSIVDMVSFGLAPALIIYTGLLNPFGRFGFIIAFIYCACAALRLALFNTWIGTADKKWFTGLPSPSAGSFVVGFVWMWYVYFPDNKIAGYLAISVILSAGFSMIAPVKFWSFKGIESKKVQNYNTWFIVMMFLLLLATQSPIIYFSFFLAYIIVSYAWAIKRYIDGNKVFPI